MSKAGTAALQKELKKRLQELDKLEAERRRLARERELQEFENEAKKILSESHFYEIVVPARTIVMARSAKEALEVLDADLDDGCLLDEIFPTLVEECTLERTTVRKISPKGKDLKVWPRMTVKLYEAFKIFGFGKMPTFIEQIQAAIKGMKK